MKLADYLEPLAYDIAFWMAGLRDPAYPIAQLGRLSVELSAKLRAAAIIVLLTKGDADAFLHNLIRSANCRLEYLRRLHALGIRNDHHQVSARTGPVLDAIAASQFDLARELGDLACPDWQRQHEYEDDHHYGRSLRLMCGALQDVAAVDAQLRGFERALAGRVDPRLDVLRAIVGRDQSAFDDAFESLLAMRSDAIDAARARGQLEEPQVVAERQVDVEALAMLKLAEQAGLRTETDYRYCPSLARVPMSRPFPGE